MAKKIMVVDDSFMVRQQVGRALVEAGFEVLEAADGLDALQQLAANEDISLVVCDVNMPRMGGIEFLEGVRKEGGYDKLPIVMLTTEGQTELVQRAKVLGAKGWITKPFRSDLLVAAAKKLSA